MIINLNLLKKFGLLGVLFFAFGACRKGESEQEVKQEAYAFTLYATEQAAGDGSKEYFRIGKPINLLAPADFQEKYAVAVQKLKKSVVDNNKKAVVEDKAIIVLKRDTTITTKNKDYFSVKVTPSKITAVAPFEQGLLNAVRWIETNAHAHDGNIPVQQVADSSLIPVRALHVAIWGWESMEYMEGLVDLARQHHFNTLMILVTNGIDIPGLTANPQRKRWTISQLEKLSNYARQSGMEVIPEMSLLTNVDRQLWHKPSANLLYNNSTYDPTNSEVYKIVFPAIDTVLDITKSQKFHVGHDEVVGYTGFKNDAMRVGKDNKGLPPHLFLKDVEKIDSFLTVRNIQPMMWGDMFLPPSLFPKMLQTPLHGVDGYQKILKDIPDNTIICDYHYHDKQKKFPSYKYFIEKGFTTYGATWKKFKTTQNFANYVAELPIPMSKKGMIATTWYGPKHKNLIKEIIIKSGDIFWNAK